MSTNKVKGDRGELKAAAYLAQDDWQILERGTVRTPWDLRVEKDGDILAVEVKAGKNSYGLRKKQLNRLLEHCAKTHEVPALLFLRNNGYALFSLENATNIEVHYEWFEKYPSLLAYLGALFGQTKAQTNYLHK